MPSLPRTNYAAHEAPQPVAPSPDGPVMAGAYGADMGLTMRQHVWLTLYAACLGDDRGRAWAEQNADHHAPKVLARLKGMA
jgi:hypothetical protein